MDAIMIADTTEQKTEGTRHWRHLFHAAGMRMTRTRLDILRVLQDRHDHPTIQKLFEVVRARFPRLSKFTIYRAMNAMEAAGMVRRIGVWKGSVRYDGNLSSHAHFLCIKCGRIVDVAGTKWEEVTQHLLPLSNNVLKYDLLLHGVVVECAAQNQAEEDQAI